MKRKNKIVSDINITPFTDVVLVLLIIFMITTPMLSNNEIKINLPKAEVTENAKSKNIEITADKDGFIYIDNKQVHMAYLEEAIFKLTRSNPDKAVVIKGDKNVQYDLIIQIIDKAKKTGVTKFALAVDTKSSKK
ncbi:ExbD/TolR family protein [Candidatus Ruminimicrobium bovinum]|uniref:ExbD/TolR family protein n=1 Tax=Candidatus Ruminimicrobium bovinum TaxID=3242779 RepID=UPI0039B84E4A